MVSHQSHQSFGFGSTGNKMIKLKGLLDERYVSKRSDTIEDVYQSAVDALEDLSDLFKKHAPEERLLSRTLEKQSMMVRRMITKSKSYQDIKDISHD